MQPLDARLTTLKNLIGDVISLRQSADLIEWDERVCMPPGGAETHGEMQSTVRKIAHEKFTAPEVGELLRDLSREAREVGLDSDSDVSRLIRVTARDYEKATRVPAAFVAEHARAVSAAQHAWAQARAEAISPASSRTSHASWS